MVPERKKNAACNWSNPSNLIHPFVNFEHLRMVGEIRSKLAISFGLQPGTLREWLEVSGILEVLKN